jgi:hypothetical protein
VLIDPNLHKNTAVFLTTGVVGHCYLVSGAKSIKGNYNVKHIGLRPFAVEHQRAMALLGAGLKTDNIAGPLYDGLLVLQTRREMDTSDGNSLTCTSICSLLFNCTSTHTSHNLAPGPATPSRRFGRTQMTFKKASTGFPSSLYYTDTGICPFIPFACVCI